MEEVKSTNKTNIGSIILIIFLVIVGFILGQNVDRVFEKSNISVIVNGETQIFRDNNGKVINVIEKNGTIYMPVNGLGSYLDYMTINDKKGLSFYKVENKFQGSVQSQKVFEGLSTKTIYGEEVTDSIFADSDYSVVMFWATWCKYCKAEIEDFAKLNDYLEKNNIQFISVVTDLAGVEENAITQADIDTVENLQGDLEVDYTVLRNTFINKNFLKGSYSLPKLYIVDNQGSLVKIVDEDITSEQFIEIFDAILK